MSSVLYALGRAAFRARGWVVAAWAAVVGLLVASALLVGAGTTNTYTFPGTESQDALDSLARTFPQFSGTSAQLVAVAPEGGDVTTAPFRSAVQHSMTAIGKIPQVSGVTTPYGKDAAGIIAPDDSAVLVPIQLSVGTADVEPSTSAALQEQGRALRAALPDGSQVAVGGQLFSQVDPGIGASEASGLLIALVVLLFTFGTLVAAGMPILTAVTGVGTSVAIVLAGTRFVTVTSTGPLLAVMLGLAVGVDYALFIISRHQDQLRSGLSPEESAPRAVATAGSAVVFAATTVIIALLGLAIAGIPFLTITGLAAALAVASAAVVALTLTPALMGLGGWRMVRRRDRPGHRHREGDNGPVDDDAEPDDGRPVTDGAEGDAEAAPDDDTPASEESAPATAPAAGGLFGHWERLATRWPPVTVLLVAVLLLATALPALHLRLALPDAGSLPEDTPGRVAYDLIADHFGPGYNGPLLVTGSVIQSTDPVTLVDDLATEIEKVPGVESVPLATPNQTGDTALVQVIPEGAPDSEETEAVVHAIRDRQQALLDEYAVELSVTGYTALGVDISARLAGASLPFGLLVVGLSLLLLAMVFRSVVVPVTAALGYALSIGAAFGLTSLVFVDGVLAGPLEVDHVGSVISFMPIILMGVLFGLAMDYEVFLVSRMREDYVHHGEPRAAIQRGFGASARVVTAAALIMTAVFGGFIRNGEASIQPIAFGLTVGVAIDAFLVRMTLVPAVLAWAGRYAWWFPAGLDRVLPRFDVEGEGLRREDELAGWPEAGDALALAAEGVRTGGAAAGPGVDAMVETGGVLVVTGGTPAQRRDLLLGLTGRVPISAGRCRVAGLVLPPRAAAVRGRTSVALLGRSADPVTALAQALLGDVRLIAVDGADAVADPVVRRELRSVLTEAAAGAHARARPGVALVLGTSSFDRVADLVPPEVSPHVVALDGTPSTPTLVTHHGAG